MKHSLIALLAALALSACGGEKKAATESGPSHACRQSNGKIVYAVDEIECEKYYSGDWEGDD